MTNREIDFSTDKYNSPVYLSKRDSIAQIIINGLFLKKGNLPSHPDRGVDIESYLYKPSDSVDQLKILTDLKATCGESLVGNELQSLTFQMVNYQGKEVALIIIKLLIDTTEDVMAISLQRGRNDTVRYQYNFINEDVPV